MKNLEYFNHWYDKILNAWPFCLYANSIKSIGFAWLFKDPAWRVMPRVTDNLHQYYNAVFFIRFNWPFGIFMMIRWSETSFVQIGIGWKLNGRFGIHLRKQTDISSAQAYHDGLSNTDHVSGFNYGAH